MSYTYSIDIQNVSSSKDLPSFEAIKQWASAAMEHHLPRAALSIRIVDESESCELNQRYRGVARSTNVLSFPADLPAGLDLPWLGDLVLCPVVIEREAYEQHKLPQAHWAHMIVHGILHLLSYDHVEKAEAELMESLEIDILKTLNVANPYMEDYPQHYE